ncbi:odorant receptor 33b-like [Cochliomyia hominivorax]
MTKKSKTPVKAENFYRVHLLCWRILGLWPTEKYRALYQMYAIILNILVTIGYPLHLILGLYHSNTMYDIIKNMAINLTCLLCTIKMTMIWIKFRNMEVLRNILSSQIERISLKKDEKDYYQERVLNELWFVLKMFMLMYTLSWSSSEISVLLNGFNGNWRLMYPAYFPFDPFASTSRYMVAHIYQFFGVTIQIIQGFVIDTYLALELGLLSGQLHTLAMRVAKLGRDQKQKTKKEINQELLECIQDHKDLLRYRSKLEDMFSMCMFFQLLITSLNMCASIVFVILFVTDPYTFLYYCAYFSAITFEIFPVCYYGSVMEMEFQNLTYALFSSNWLQQDAMFRQNLRIFAETTKKPLHMMAWQVRINLNSFLIVCKNAYSLFAVIMNFK